MARPKKSNRSDGRFEIQRTIGYTADGQAIKKSFYGSNKEEALRRYQDFLTEAERKAEAKKRTDFVSWVEEWLYTYKEGSMKETSFLSSYKRPCYNVIIPYFQGCILQDISNADVKRFCNTIVNKSQSQIDKVLMCLRNIFEVALDNDMIAKNPCRNITCKSKQEKEPKRVYDEETANALCKMEHKYALLVHILLRMGLRCSELCGLRWEDINLDKGIMSISQALTTEGGVIYIDDPKSYNSKRKLPIPPDLLERLRENAGEGYIAMLNGNHIRPDHFNDRQLRAFYNKTGVPKDKRLSAHELRHTCGTILYETTKDIYHVSRFLGHSDINITTKIYVHSEMQEEKVHIDF
jgi:integrase